MINIIDMNYLSVIKQIPGFKYATTVLYTNDTSIYLKY